ncbi:hypothetical protein GCM10027416_16930 [Okibacterium endophyticum]
MAEQLSDPFRAYHRAEDWRSRVRGGVTLVVVSLLVGAGVWASSQASSMSVAAETQEARLPASPPADPAAQSTADAPPGGPASGTSAGGTGEAADAPPPAGPADLPVEVAAEAPPAADPAPPVDLPSTGPREFDIGVDTTGHQAEVDLCLWVRMDLGAVAPIVGRHNHCGGDVVLDMREGDVVHLSGSGLDGTYTVTGSRDAHAGDNAAQATEGLQASVILQTCYTGSTKLRLVTLVAVSGGEAGAP